MQVMMHTVVVAVLMIRQEIDSQNAIPPWLLSGVVTCGVMSILQTAWPRIKSATLTTGFLGPTPRAATEICFPYLI